jgi:predicted HAD superfamily hydrolase
MYNIKNEKTRMPDTSSDISCFDVFDTLLTRKVSDPTSVFFLTAQQAIKASIINCPPEVYVSIRRQAEQLSRKEADDGQIHYLRIFDYLSEILSISQSQSRQLMALELEWEKNVL